MNQSPQGGVPARPNPEKIADVQIGPETAAIIREVDPDGAIVMHAVKKSPYAHERMHDLGRIDDEMYDAAERFRKDFERANLDGRFSTIDLFRSIGGQPNLSDGVMEARQRVRSAYLALGGKAAKSSLSASCVWFVVGCGHTFENWALRIRTSGGAMTAERASGILTGALERLVLHYGMSSPGDLKNRARRNGQMDGVRYAADLAELFHMSVEGKSPQEALKMFATYLREKVAKVKRVE